MVAERCLDESVFPPADMVLTLEGVEIIRSRWNGRIGLGCARGGPLRTTISPSRQPEARIGGGRTSS